MRFRSQCQVTSTRRIVISTTPPPVLDDILDLLRYVNTYLTHIYAGNMDASIYAVNDFLVDMTDGMLSEMDLTEGKEYLSNLFTSINELFFGNASSSNQLMHGRYQAKWLGQVGKEFVMSVEANRESHGLRISLLTEVGMDVYNKHIGEPFAMVMRTDQEPFRKAELRKQIELVMLNQLSNMALEPLSKFQHTLSSPLTRPAIQAGLGLYIEENGRSIVDAVHEATINLYSIIWQILEGYRLTAVNADNEKVTDYVPTDFDSLTGQIVLLYLPS